MHLTVKLKPKERGSEMAKKEQCVERFQRVNIKNIKQVGFHYILELNGVDPKKLNNLRICRESLKQAAINSGAKIIFVRFHHFHPVGVTGVVGVEESHLSIHTWPEYGYAAIDIFLCTNETQVKIQPRQAINTIIKRFKPTFIRIKELPRGPDINKILT